MNIYSKIKAIFTDRVVMENRRHTVGTPNWINYFEDYRPLDGTPGVLPAGTYTGSDSPSGMILHRKSTRTDNLVDLPDPVVQRIADGIFKFLASRQKYQDNGLLHKRGVLLYGPPGGGKTVLIHKLTTHLVANDGIVFVYSGNASFTARCLYVIRQRERDRPILLVIEDIDQMLSGWGEEAAMLSLLDGQLGVDGLVTIATTNYPDRLGANVLNRPSRFDERVFVDMPGLEVRSVYLEKTAKERLAASGYSVADVARDTEGLSIAHLRELVASVLVLDQPYQETISRLRGMSDRPEYRDAWESAAPTSSGKDAPVGFTKKAAQPLQVSVTGEKVRVWRWEPGQK